MKDYSMGNHNNTYLITHVLVDSRCSLFVCCFYNLDLLMCMCVCHACVGTHKGQNVVFGCLGVGDKGVCEDPTSGTVQEYWVYYWSVSPAPFLYFNKSLLTSTYTYFLLLLVKILGMYFLS